MGIIIQSIDLQTAAAVNMSLTSKQSLSACLANNTIIKNKIKNHLNPSLLCWISNQSVATFFSGDKAPTTIHFRSDPVFIILHNWRCQKSLPPASQTWTYNCYLGVLRWWAAATIWTPLTFGNSDDISQLTYLLCKKTIEKRTDILNDSNH